MLAVGLALGVVGAVPWAHAVDGSILGDSRIEDATRDALRCLVLGAGLLLASLASTVLVRRDPRTSLVLDGARGVLEISGAPSARVELPLGLLARVACVTAPNTGRGGALTLQKRDGSFVELAVLPDALDPRTILDPLQRAIERAPEPADGPDDPLDYVAGHGRIDASRDGDSLRVEIGASPPLAGLVALGSVAGLALIAHAFRVAGSAWAAVATVCVLALACSYVVFTLVSWSVTERVMVDDRRVTVERLRFGRVLSTKAVSVTSVSAVDYTHQLHAHGPALTIRTQAADDRAPPMAEVESAPDELGRAVMAVLGSQLYVPLARIPPVSRFALQSMLAEEVARRKGHRRQSSGVDA